jgi:hypothetical protein
MNMKCTRQIAIGVAGLCLAGRMNASAQEPDAVVPVAQSPGQTAQAIKDKADTLAVLAQQYTWSRFAPESRALVIRTSETDGKTLAGTEEDLNIMARILDKAVRGIEGAAQPEAMGVPLTIAQGNNGVRNMQIEGYGAVFQLSVNFPLKGPEEKAEDKTPKEPTNSAWDQTKRELYGQPTRPNGNPFGAPASRRVVFDPKRVEQLKDALLEALRDASNMSHVKSDENVTVVVTSALSGNVYATRPTGARGGGAGFFGAPGSTAQGGGSSNSANNGKLVYDKRTGSTIVSEKNADGNPSVRVVHMNPGPSVSESVLTIRARKSDIDAFAKGRLTLDEFRGKAGVLVY